MADAICVLSFAQQLPTRRDRVRDEAEMVQPVVTAALDAAGLGWDDVGFVCSGSADYLVGRPFSFVAAVDGLRAFPPIRESHVEMDGAFAFYEAWVRLLAGDVDVALVYAFGKSSLGSLPEVLNARHDPYYVQPLGFDSISAAAMQAQAVVDAGLCDERAMAEVAVRSIADGLSNPYALRRRARTVADVLAEPYLAEPLRRSTCAPITDGAAAVVLARADFVHARGLRGAYVEGIDHRIEPSSLGVRDLTRSISTALAGERAGVGRGPVDLAELHAPFAHQEAILKRALGLPPEVRVNPSGGAIASNPVMVTGLVRIGEAATRVLRGEARRAVAHATAGDALQQNLVCVLSEVPRA